MKPTKKTAAKRVTKKRPAKRAVRRGSVEHKVMMLYNRIDEYGSVDAVQDLKRVDRMMKEVRNGPLCKGDLIQANRLWSKYA
jgi:hypothetical protein